jgi:hypothetical protein
MDKCDLDNQDADKADCAWALRSTVLSNLFTLDELKVNICQYIDI